MGFALTARSYAAQASLRKGPGRGSNAARSACDVQGAGGRRPLFAGPAPPNLFTAGTFLNSVTRTPDEVLLHEMSTKTRSATTELILQDPPHDAQDAAAGLTAACLAAAAAGRFGWLFLPGAIVRGRKACPSDSPWRGLGHGPLPPPAAALLPVSRCRGAQGPYRH